MDHEFEPLQERMMASLRPRPPIVVGVSDSASSLAATRVAADEAVRRRLPLRLAYASPPGHPQSNAPRLPSGVVEVVEEVHLAHPDLDISQRIAPMQPSDLLLEESETATLIVLGSPSHSGGDEEAATCTAQQVLQGAGCPVVVADRPDPSAHPLGA